MDKINVIKTNAKYFDDVYIKSQQPTLNCDSESIIIDYILMKSYLTSGVDALIITATNSYVSIDLFCYLKKYIRATIPLIDNNIIVNESATGELEIIYNNGSRTYLVGLDDAINHRKYSLIYLRNGCEDVVDFNILTSVLRSNGRIITNDEII